MTPKLSPRARAASGLYGTGAAYSLKPENLTDEVPLEVGALVVLTAKTGMAGKPGKVLNVIGAEGDPWTVALEYFVAYGNGKEGYFNPDEIEQEAGTT